MHALYGDLVAWYRLLDPVEDHREEAAVYAAALTAAVSPAPRTLLELGSGAGHNGFFLKRQFACTLADLSVDMLGLSRTINSDCEHVQGDMRTLRLDRTFDAVFVHDAIVYMTTEADLAAAAATAFAHTRAGGVALFVPDCLTETFAEATEVYEAEDATHGLRGVGWMWDPDPTDSTYTVDYAFLLRDRSGIRSAHDRHVEGLFPRATWLRILSTVGFHVTPIARPLDTEDNPDGVHCEVMFLCRRG